MSAARASRRLRSLAPALLALGLPCASVADAVEPHFKLSLGDYRYSDGYAGQDVNLRWRNAGRSVWLGSYHDRVFGSQARAGFDAAVALAASASVQASLQVASGGFVGGSATVTLGDPWFVVAGWGRTNLRPYFNLNFDPNDAVTLGAGWHGTHGVTLSSFVIADDRLHSGQKDWHLFGQWPLANESRLTLDVLRKTGEGDGGAVHAWGWSATYDFADYFVRVAHDPKQNFSTQDAMRLTAGLRF